MSNSCCVDECRNKNIGGNSGVVFYKFPDIEAVKTKWINAVNKKDWLPDDSSVICSCHFVTGQRHSQEWHPDYVPSVFRNIRRTIKKPKWRDMDESEDESNKTTKGSDDKSRKRIGPLSKVTKPGSSIKRLSLTTPTRNTKKSSIAKKSTKLGRPYKNKTVFRKEEKSSYETVIDIPVKLMGNDVPKKVSITKVEGNSSFGSKIKEDAPEYEVMPILKNLSIVLERTSEKKIKLSTGGENEVEIKEEPQTDDEDYDMVAKETPRKEQEYEEEEEEEYAEETLNPEFEAPSPMDECYNCDTLKQKLNRLELNMKKAAGGKCKQCGILRNKLIEAEVAKAEQIEAGGSASGGKCNKCTTQEMKNKRIESQLRKLQTELAEMHNKLAAIEISEQAFKKYKSKVKMYTGLPNYETLAVIFDHLKPHFPPTGVKALNPFQMFVLVLMRAKLNLPFWDLTYRFGAPPNTIQQYYSKFIDVIEAQLSHVILWPKANLHYRLQVLASNLKQSYGIIKNTVDVDTLLVSSSPLLEEDDKVTRVCAALYHISQLVSSNHSQQLVRILRSRDETERPNITMKTSDKKTEESKMDVDMDEDFDEDTKAKIAEGILTNGEVDDSDIFFEDFTKETAVNSNDSLALECKSLRKEADSLKNKLDAQFRVYTGTRSFEVFNNLLSFFENHITHISNEKLTYFQQLQLVLMRFKLNLDVQDLSCMFGVDVDHIVYVTRQWIDVIMRQLSQYIDWPAGIEDEEGEKKLLGTVKIKYQILWGPRIASRNKATGREREKIDMKKLIRACAAIYNIDDIEVFKNGQKDSTTSRTELDDDDASNETLEKECCALRTELYKLRRCTIQHYTSSIYTADALKEDDQMVKFCTGFASYEILRNVFDVIVPPTKEDSRKLLTPFQQFMAVLLRLRLNLSIYDIGFRFGMGPSNVHKLFQDWLGILHSRLSPHITWPDDDEDVEVFTDVLRKTYAYLRASIPTRKKDQERKLDAGYYDMATLVCAGLYNIGEVTYTDHSDVEFDSFDEDW